MSQILKREIKFRWKKLKKLSKELEHLASNIQPGLIGLNFIVGHFS